MKSKTKRPKSRTGSTPSITKRDFDKAVKQKWSTESCILFQTAMRVFNLPLHLNLKDENQKQNANLYSDGNTLLQFTCSSAQEAMEVFDRFFKLPGDEKRTELQALRASLPIKVKL